MKELEEAEREDAIARVRSDMIPVLGDDSYWVGLASTDEKVRVFESSKGLVGLLATGTEEGAEEALVDDVFEDSCKLAMIWVLRSAESPLVVEAKSFLEDIMAEVKGDAVISFVTDGNVARAFGSNDFECRGKGDSADGSRTVLVAVKSLRKGVDLSGSDLSKMADESDMEEAKSLAAEARQIEREQEARQKEAYFWQVAVPLGIVILIVIISVALVQSGFFKGISELTLDGRDPMQLRWVRAKKRAEQQAEFEARIAQRAKEQDASGITDFPETQEFAWVEDDGDVIM